jgi:non-ribosomal peptide synthetase component F
MNNPDPLDDLFAQARAQRADTSATQYAFETRLLARLREERSPRAVWGLVSWRLAPIFALAVAVLAFWQMDLSSETEEASAYASLNNPAASELWNALN